jgi:hypothetical protein
MASNTTVPVAPNPDTPLAFLPPILADQFQVSCYVVVGGLSVSTRLQKSASLGLDRSHFAGIRVGLAYVHSGRVRDAPKD